MPVEARKGMRFPGAAVVMGGYESAKWVLGVELGSSINAVFTLDP